MTSVGKKWRRVIYRFLMSSLHHSAHHGPRWRSNILGALLLILAGCGGSTATTPVSGPGVREYAIVFTAGTAYDDALQTVTDLGLQPGFYCGATTIWQPAGQRASFAQQQTLVVLPFGAPADWMTRLAAVPSVVSVVNALPSYPDQPAPATTPAATATFSPFEPAGSSTIAPYGYACPSVAPPATQTPATFTSAQAGAYARVTFTSPLDTYAGALAVAVNLGLPLANPCRDVAAGHGTPLPWQSPGQEGSFASTRALVVVTTWEFTSNQWQRQLAQVPGVSGVRTLYAPVCS